MKLHTLKKALLYAVENKLDCGLQEETDCLEALKEIERIEATFEHEEPNVRVCKDNTFNALVERNILLEYQSIITNEGILQDLHDRNMYDITKADVDSIVKQMREEGFWKELDHQHTAEEVDEFLRHINKHIAETPIGGYTDPTKSSVEIRVGYKSWHFYDHAALIQSIIDALEHLKTEM